MNRCQDHCLSTSYPFLLRCVAALLGLIFLLQGTPVFAASTSETAPNPVYGVAFIDEDGDQQRAFFELGLSDVAIQVWPDVDGDGQIDAASMLVDEEITGSEGGFLFAELPVGIYILKAVKPEGYDATTELEKQLILTDGDAGGGIEINFGLTPAAGGSDDLDDIGDVCDNLGSTLYLSSTTGGWMGDVRFRDEDILACDGANGGWQLTTRLRDFGITIDVTAMAFLPDGTQLLVFNRDTNVPEIGAVTGRDIVHFDKATGQFALYFQGSDVGLIRNRERIDGLAVLADGSLVISLRGRLRMADGTRYNDEDLLRFVPTMLGDETRGEWSLYLDGSDIGLGSAGGDIRDFWINEVAGDIYFANRSGFTLGDQLVTMSDIAVCHVTSLGDDSACDLDIFWRGADFGFGDEKIDAMEIGAVDLLAASVDPRSDDDSIDDLEEDIFDTEDEFIFIPLIVTR